MLRAFASRAPSYCVAFWLMLVPLAFFVEGKVGTPLLNGRYLQPVTLGFVLITAELLRLTRLSVRLKAISRISLRLALGLSFALVLNIWIFYYIRNISFSTRDYTPALNKLLPKDVPVVVEDAFTFTELIGRQHTSGVDYRFLLDWNQSISPAAPLVEVTQYHLMENWKQSGYFAGSIEDADEFFKTEDHFFVIHSDYLTHPKDPQPIGDPIIARLQSRHDYDIRDRAHPGCTLHPV